VVGYGSFSRFRQPPWPLAGGTPGTPNAIEYETAAGTMRVGRTARVELREGDAARAVTGAGGGYGPPGERSAAQVREDVLDGYVSVEQASDEYGVVLDPSTLVLDEDATRARRAAAG
jgi:N-methylhydantoinase B